MYVRATRYSFKDDGAMEKGNNIYSNKAKPLWSKQKGFHSMNLFRIADGPNKGQEMVALRFESKDAWEKARDGISQQREEFLKGLEEAGVKTEEVLELEEVT